LKLYDVSFVNQRTGVAVESGHWVVFSYLIQAYPVVFALAMLGSFMSKLVPLPAALLSSLTGLSLFAFFGFHMWLVSQNKTTNEFFKWREVWKKYKSHEEGEKPFNSYRQSVRLNFQEVFYSIFPKWNLHVSYR
jgi:hypothetical protein